MSNTDSFIEEVTEEVRKDRLNALVRRYGWIAVAVVIAIVGAAGAWEWRKAQDKAAAQALGDDILTALELSDPAARVTALESVSATGDAFALRQLVAVAETPVSDPAQAERLLRSVIEDESVSPLYRDLATLRLSMVPDVAILSEDRLALLEPLTVPGGAFRLSALEQKALVHVERGESDLALQDLVILRDDVESSAAMRDRAAQLIVALGGLPDEE
ncbi:MAG: tetratricopeptide repeat protein [Mangrovicoccus sp.]|nr:tetratricopeptide repeat protein [Mangrovicoccus sp.]